METQIRGCRGCEGHKNAKKLHVDAGYLGTKGLSQALKSLEYRCNALKAPVLFFPAKICAFIFILLR